MVNQCSHQKKKKMWSSPSKTINQLFLFRRPSTFIRIKLIDILTGKHINKRTTHREDPTTHK